MSLYTLSEHVNAQHGSCTIGGNHVDQPCEGTNSVNMGIQTSPQCKNTFFFLVKAKKAASLKRCIVNNSN